MKLYKFFAMAILFVMVSGLLACRAVSTEAPMATQPPEPPLISTPVPTPIPTATPKPVSIEPLPLTETDFIVEYNNFAITPSTTYAELIEALGDGSTLYRYYFWSAEYEEYYKNNAYIIGSTEIINLNYAEVNDDSYNRLRVVFHKNVTDGSSYIAFIDLTGNPTQRGLRVASALREERDTKQKVIDLYGQPDEILQIWQSGWQSGRFSSYRYYFGEMYLEIILSFDEVYNIRIYYKSEPPKQQNDSENLFDGLENLTVKFYFPDISFSEVSDYKTEEISVANFVEDTIKFFNLHYDMQVNNIWYEGGKICIDLNYIEFYRFDAGSSAGMIYTSLLTKTLSSFPNVEEIEILLDGEKGRWADHFNFNGIFKVKEGKWN